MEVGFEAAELPLRPAFEVSQITTAQQSVSGVNLDEEASNLLQYQQLYQANSKVIQTAASLFQTLLGIFQ